MKMLPLPGGAMPFLTSHHSDLIPHHKFTKHFQQTKLLHKKNEY